MRYCAALLAFCACAFGAAAPTKIVLIAGKPSHGPGAHEFNAGMLLLEKCLRQTPGVEPVVVKGGWPDDDALFTTAAAIVLYMDGGAKHPILSGSRLETLAKLTQRGV